MAMTNTNFLANFFDWNREVVEAAESPFARLAAFILPILAPSVPAFITSIRLYTLYLGLISGRLSDSFAFWGAVVTAIVLEILGYVGTVAAVRFIYKWAKTRRDEYLIPMALTGLAYGFYLIAMALVNIQLSLDNPNTDLVLTYLAGLSIPAGLIFASNLVENEEKRTDAELRREQNQYKLERLKIKQGYQSTTNATPQLKKGDWRTLSADQKREVINVLTVDEIMRKHNVGRSTAFSWKSKKI